MFNPTALGYYNRGDQFPKLIVNNLNSSIQSVMLPSLSSVQDDKPRLKVMMRRAIVTSSFFILPLMAGLAAVATPLTLVVLGEKWLPAVPFIQICCVIYAFWPIHTTNLSAVNAVGRSDIFLKLELIKKGYGLVAIAIAVLFFRSPIGIAMSSAITAPLGAFVNAYPNKKLLNYGYIEQTKDILPSMALSILMGGCVYFVSCWLSDNFAISPVLQLVILTFLGMALYLGLARLLHLECLEYLIKTVKEFRNRKK